MFLIPVNYPQHRVWFNTNRRGPWQQHMSEACTVGQALRSALLWQETTAVPSTHRKLRVGELKSFSWQSHSQQMQEPGFKSQIHPSFEFVSYLVSWLILDFICWTITQSDVVTYLQYITEEHSHPTGCPHGIPCSRSPCDRLVMMNALCLWALQNVPWP